jgi:hypothetical protein
MAVVSKEFPVIWSSTPFFIPHALACSKRSIFLADRFHVFELENGENLRELCKFNQPILDVIGYCDDQGKSCRPVVLFRKGGKRNNVVEFHDCIKGNHTSELKQALGELGHAGTYFRRDNGVATRLLVTTHQDVLLQSRLSEQGDIWEPDWTMGTVDSKSLRSVSTHPDFLMLYNAHSIEARSASRSTSSESRIGVWDLPEDVGEIYGGCRIPGTANVMTLSDRGDDYQPRLLELALPGLENSVLHPKTNTHPMAHSLLERRQRSRGSGGFLGLDVESQGELSNSTRGTKRLQFSVKGPWRERPSH